MAQYYSRKSLKLAEERQNYRHNSWQALQMKTTTNESVFRETNPILQLRRTLLPIDEYAARQGLSRRTVQQQVQSGIIQIRKYKGKTYVVDVPLSPHHHTPEELCLMEEDSEMTASTIEQPAQSTDATHAETISGRTAGVKSASQCTQIPFSDPLQPGILSTAKWTKRTRKVLAVASTACLLAVIMASFWLYTNQTIHGDRLDKAFATIRTVHYNSIQTSQQLAALHTNLAESTAELQSVRNELNKTMAQVTGLQKELKRIKQGLETSGNEPPGSAPQVTELTNLLNKTRAEVQTLRSQIALASESLGTTKQQTTRALDLLRAQIQQLTALLNELAKNRQSPTDPNGPEE
jgi:hypothetical protein